MKAPPNAADPHISEGVAFVRRGDYEKAAKSFRRATKIEPMYAVAHNNLGGALVELGRFDSAASSFKRALELNPDYAEAHHNLGVAVRRMGRPHEAIASFNRALKLKPDYADAYNNLGIAFAELGRNEDAIASYSRALQLKPAFALAHNNLGNVLRKLGRPEEAVTCYMRALKLNPAYAEAYYNLALVLRMMNRREEAVECFQRALQLTPGMADCHADLGVTLAELRRPEESIACFARALRLAPDLARARAQMMHQLARICDWDALANETDGVGSLGIDGGTVPPFALLSLDDDPMRHRIRAERFAAANYDIRPLSAFSPPSQRPDRLRVGYFSSDFYDHATMYLMVRLFETSDRSRFTLHAYSFGPVNNDAMRMRTQQAFDVFRDVHSLSDGAIAELARQDGLDIAVDLKGYTQGNRTGLFAHGLAPVQISYLGYPGTSGAPFMDYIIADKTVIPADNQQWFSEKVIYLPHCYQVNDNTRVIAEQGQTRVEAGLPEHAFVFCCFNNTYKITPTEFDIWMRLLRRIEGSVLWLFASTARAEVNLRDAAAKRGVEPSRIVFARQLPLPQHLARHRLADLFLDTFNYNAHTTASDALWAGLPVLTKVGRGFAARVAASLLSALELTDMIAASEGDYEEQAFSLANQPEKLREVRLALEAKRLTSPLFDTAMFARNLEAAYEQVYKRYRDGQPPESITIGS
jgi:predicted O-linked N-acetylglucosamine transferase (SPINDLY family)